MPSASQPAPPAGGRFLFDSPGSAFAPEDLSAEARLMGQSMEEFARTVVVPAIDRLTAGEPADTMRDLVRQAGRLGLLAAGMPRRYGGLGLLKTTTALLAEKSAADLSFAITISVHTGVGALPLLLFGADDIRDRYLPGIAKGEIIAAFALSEGNSGSDALAAQTRALRPPPPLILGKPDRQAKFTSEHYRLDGTKLWVTNGGFADVFTIFAQAPEGFTAFVVPRDSPGLTVSGEEKKLGLRGSSTRRVFLNDVPVPADAVIGEVGKGHRPALYALNAGRFNIGAIALGGAKEALRLATRYAAQRRQSGRPIAEFDLVAGKLADMTARIFALESMVYRTAGLWDAALDAGRDPADVLEEYAVECAIVKFFGTEVLAYAVDECVQIHGGFGYSEDFPAARLYRDARVFRIFEGTNEINRLTAIDQMRRRTERGRLPPIDSTASETAHEALPILRTLTRHAMSKVLACNPGQIAAAAAADLAALLYALESVNLRAAKMPHPSSTLASTVDLFAECALAAAIDHARVGLASTGTTHAEAMSILLPVVNRPLVDMQALKRVIAVDARACGGYPM